MPDFGFLDHDGRFGAFWYDSEEKITVFLPHKSPQIMEGSIAHWKRHGEYEGTPGDKVKYPLEFNAAALVTAQANCYMRKETVRPLAIPRGHYYPRVWRGIPPRHMLDSGYNGLALNDDEQKTKTKNALSAASLFEEMNTLFRSVEPSSANDATFGHKIRELLILACTEVEANWRGVYQSNTSSSKKPDGTRDYIKLMPLLRLDEWVVCLKNHPDYPELKPFENWNDSEGMTTRSLAWYNSYNAVKHDREREFNQATLGSLIMAMAAIHVLQVAQWGPGLYLRFQGNQFSIFETVTVPEYKAHEQYILVEAGLRPSQRIMYFG
ncbi:hypothetical protein [Pseudomonas cichorii]|uniref:Uncharacterized protein n=1 Tax=Pseudomonas cichorii TaxID=36746 RepID=A0A3M4WIN9_PSECI|nr:hypothetical protein [Pseudomonas cichorii]AHF66536.1 hypothetical protein PCH70_13830 [Pseudomonas cichorii JBC1]QVE18463.1 hypothetical protein KGD89_06880 [Pseudomonas cichorii]RMR63152.1 hypothetical protein ALP84_01876 [Pseudomonas cichorii]SDO33176.1 hypothetical protein SAMN05216599_1086 [Pseudomonas cichorii]GFM95020.1 hypothetical protein PSCICP_49920 [Pseudomonas cichorii]